MTVRQAVISVCVLVLIIPLPDVTDSFQPLLYFDGTSISHWAITNMAVLQKTAEVCRDMAATEGRDFRLNIDNSLSAYKVQRACSSTDAFTAFFSSRRFRASITEMCFSNALVDVIHLLSDVHHFVDEKFEGGRDIITAGVAAVKASVKQESFVSGRWTLGRICHTLQDFYSHSNWVELGNKTPCSTLIRPDQPFTNLAGPDTPTCRSCVNGDCKNNLLPELMRKGLLTTGYFNLFSSAKPPGKCSHGGLFDRTSRADPVGGIHKDHISASHGFLHLEAAYLAVNATMELLEDIRLAIGDKNFLRLMGIPQSSVLCFVIDTTGSMNEDIAKAKKVAFDIIDGKRGTQQEPSAYILVPFNDPGFGPLSVTTNADVFKSKINKLSADGGGDVPELCLSALKLALTAAPPYSEIFVFTDAPAKDAYLRNTIIALIESTKSTVTFMKTHAPARGRRRRSFPGVSPRSVGHSDVQLYYELAEVSGGQVIEVTKSDLSLATSIIEDSSASAVVTVFQVVKKPGRPERFNFTVDDSLMNVNIYITGAPSITFSLTSPTGVSQSSTTSSGPLAWHTRVGNLHRLSLKSGNPIGSWQIRVNSNNPYSVKVTGQSSVDFIYNLVEAREEVNGDLSLKEGRPLSGQMTIGTVGTFTSGDLRWEMKTALTLTYKSSKGFSLTGGNVTLLVSVTGSDTIKVNEVTLYDGSRPTEVKGSFQSVGDDDYLVTFTALAAGDFVLVLKGEESSSTSPSTPGSFQRQASTKLKTSNISVSAQANVSDIEPGSTISIPFTVAMTTNGSDSAAETLTIRANNDRSYASTAPNTIIVGPGTGGKANSVVALTVPASAASGTDVTLTIEAQNAAGTDINYTILRFSVVAKVTDFTRPVCKVVRTSVNCPSSSSDCASFQWEFIANITDGINGTGIERVSISQGKGSFNSSLVVGAKGDNITVVTYRGSCCSQKVELAAVDGVGNVGKCVTTSSSSRGCTRSTSHTVWISVAVAVVLAAVVLSVFRIRKSMSYYINQQ